MQLTETATVMGDCPEADTIVALQKLKRENDHLRSRVEALEQTDVLIGMNRSSWAFLTQPLVSKTLTFRSSDVYDRFIPSVLSCLRVEEIHLYYEHSVISIDWASIKNPHVRRVLIMLPGNNDIFHEHAIITALPNAVFILDNWQRAPSEYDLSAFSKFPDRRFAFRPLGPNSVPDAWKVAADQHRNLKIGDLPWPDDRRRRREAAEAAGRWRGPA
jgi:hypothetical protein